MSKRYASRMALTATRQYFTPSSCSKNTSNIGLAPFQITLPQTATLSTTSTSTSTSQGNSSGTSYTSPLREFFATIQSGKTSLGTDHTKLKPLAEEIADIPRLDCGIPEHLLRFSTTCHGRLYLPPYTMTDEYKVTMKVAMKHIPLETDLEREIFMQIVANRFVPEKNELRLSANQFASRIENKRHLCAMLDRIVNGARLLAKDVYEQKRAQSDS